MKAFNNFIHILGTIILLNLFLLLCFNQVIQLNYYGIDKANDRQTIQLASCLNSIYDKIFMITIPSREHTFAISAYELQQENIDFIVWHAHHAENNYSMHLWQEFKHNSDPNLPWKHYMKINSVYYNKNAFFVRQTQLDIIKYSQLSNFKKILILEDDITIANTNLINLFCENEKHIPEWHILRLGQFEGRREIVKLEPLDSSESGLHFSYYHTNNCYGAFAISIAHTFFDHIVKYFHINNGSHIPLDSITNQDMFTVEYTKFMAINPPLFIPDVTHSVLRNATDDYAHGEQGYYMRHFTVNANISNYSNYWKLRYSNLTNISNNMHVHIPIEGQFDIFTRDSPSKYYLQQH